MRETTLCCRLLSPMFSNGRDPKIAEFRTAELKGLLRYTYRIANFCTDVKELAKMEAVLFGSTELASPVKLQIRTDNSTSESIPFIYKGENYIRFKGYPVETKFDVIIRTDERVSLKTHQEYVCMIFWALSLLGRCV